MKQFLFLMLGMLLANTAGGVITDMIQTEPMAGFLLGWFFNASAVACIWIAFDDELWNGQTQ